MAGEREEGGLKVFSIVVVAPDMEAHVGGCADLRKRSSRRFVNERNPHEYEGADIVSAIRAADVALAGWFGEKPYIPRDEGGTAWSIASCEKAPCLSKALRAAKVVFNEHGEPSVKGA